MTYWLKSCPRCHTGDLFEDDPRSSPPEIVCAQCAYRRYPKPVMRPITRAEQTGGYSQEERGRRERVRLLKLQRVKQAIWFLEHNYTQQETAQRMGVARSTISTYISAGLIRRTKVGYERA